jgi:sulfate adenylyltransferase subunit 2
MLLDELETQSIRVLREAFNKFERLAMLWSIGNDSTVLLWLARKVFFGHAPFRLVQVDNSYNTKVCRFSRRDGYM